MIDLRDALNCLQIMRLRTRTARKETPYRIGLVMENLQAPRMPHWKGILVVLFKPDEAGKDYTIELPMTVAEIKQQQEKGSLLVTKCCCIGVPREYINPVIMSDDDLLQETAATA